MHTMTACCATAAQEFDPNFDRLELYIKHHVLVVPPGLPSHAEAVAAAKAQKAPTAAAAQKQHSPQRAATPNGPSAAAAAARASSSSSSAAAVQRDYFAAADAAQYAQEVGGGAEGEALLDDELRQLRLRLRTAKRQGVPLAKRRQEVHCASVC
jgi:hypothetical protein